MPCTFFIALWKPSVVTRCINGDCVDYRSACHDISALCFYPIHFEILFCMRREIQLLCVVLGTVTLLFAWENFSLAHILPVLRDSNCTSALGEWQAPDAYNQSATKVGICINHVTRSPDSDSVIVTMLTEGVERYSLGSLKLIASIQRRADTPTSDFLLLELAEKPLPDEIRVTLIYAGWKPCMVHRIPAREPVNPHFTDQFTKLVLWKLVEYTKVVYLDSDCVVTGSLKPLLQMNLSSHPIWAAMDILGGTWGPGFNMGVFAIQPSVKEFKRLMLLKDSNVAYNTLWSEQGFLNVVYRCVWGDIGFVNNANLAAFLDDRHKWAMHAGEINVIHYTTWKPFKGGHWEYTVPISLWNSVRVYPTARERRRCPVTFVSQYFVIQSEYEGRLDTDMCLVIFSDEVDRFQSAQNRVVVHVDLDSEARIFNQTPLFWQGQLDKGLYWARNLKSVFMQRAANANPFDSLYFFWIDVGYIHKAERQFQWDWFWPPKDIMQSHKIFLATAGAVWGGHQSAVLAWSEAYMSVFLDYVARGRLVGKDQHLLSTTCLKRRDLCELVTHGDMLQYLQTCTQCSAALTARENHFSIKHF